MRSLLADLPSDHPGTHLYSGISANGGGVKAQIGRVEKYAGRRRPKRINAISTRKLSMKTLHMSPLILVFDWHREIRI